MRPWLGALRDYLAEQRRIKAEASEQVAKEQEAQAKKEKANVLRLAAFQTLDDLTREADELWPAAPGMVDRLRRCGLLWHLVMHGRMIDRLRLAAGGRWGGCGWFARNWGTGGLAGSWFSRGRLSSGWLCGCRLCCRLVMLVHVMLGSCGHR